VLPTFVIGLREGLEAALIVSILATFLRRNGASLRGLWIGVTGGVVLSAIVGVILRVVEQSLPQRGQEAMETVIGAIAVFFVTGMVVWMSRHARHLKRELEAAASDALGNGTTTALAVMAFLAVLREGFETSVFLLATFQNASSAPDAMLGALFGILVAVVLGIGIYKGGVRLNLQRFFQITGVFLIFVAAGLVLNAFRTGHEAGWVLIGQGTTVDLSWLVAPGSVRSALITGVLGIPADPRVIEVVGWFCYLLPMLAFAYWPARFRPGRAAAQRLRGVGALVAAVAAVVLFAVVSVPSAQAAQPALPKTLGLTRLLTYTGQRIPVGVDPSIEPGPYDVAWTPASTPGTEVLTLSGGGLSSPRVLTVALPASQLPSPALMTVRADRQLWKLWFPGFLLLVAMALVVRAARSRAAGSPEAAAAVAAPAPTEGKNVVHASSEA